MESVMASASAQLAHATSQPSETAMDAGEAVEQAEPFLATIVRLDQATAEQVFREATR